MISGWRPADLRPGPWRRFLGRPARAGLAMWLAGCYGPGLDIPEYPTDTTTVSNTVAKPDSPGEGGTVAYVYLPPGTVPQGIAASIRNLDRGTTTLAFPVGGGFDPVPVPASPSDRLVLEVRGAGQQVLFRREGPVPSRRRPVVVRSNPPPRKRDVPLNASLVIVFSEPIAGPTLSAGSVHLVGDHGPVSGQIALDPDGLRAEFIPDQPLVPNTGYRLALTTDVTDLAGEPLEPLEVEFISAGAPPSGLSRIAFGDCPGGDDFACGIFVMNADGSDVTELTDPLSIGNLDPLWSPDGRKIAFSSFRHCLFGVPGRCFSEIYVMNGDGTGVVRLTDRPDTSSYLPTWSPDGRRLAFQSTAFRFPGGGIADVDIYAIDADGSNLVRLTDHPAFDIGPAWSPDGTRIAFSSDRDGDEEIYLMDGDGSNLLRLTNRPGSDQQPRWSPDGTRIVFSSYGDGNGEIYLMQADGSGVVRLTDHPEYDNGPTWSPDQTRIAFTSGRNGSGLFVMNADGSGVTLLRPGFASAPSWSPFGSVPPPASRVGPRLRR